MDNPIDYNRTSKEAIHERVIDVLIYLKRNQSISLGEVAENIGVARQNMPRIFSRSGGGKKLTVESLARLCVAYNINIDWVMTGRGEMLG